MKSSLSPIIPNVDRTQGPLFDNTNRLARFVYRFRGYHKLLRHARKYRVPYGDLARIQFPYLLPVARKPPSLTIEFTSHCNLKCPYCSSPNAKRERGYMSDETFASMVRNLRETRVSRVRVHGNGEPTIHKNFIPFVRELSKTVRFLSVLSNGQWTNKDLAYEIVAAGVPMIEVTVEAGGKEAYESSRVGGSWERLLENLEALQKAKQQLKANSVVNVRLMIRPSQRAQLSELMRFWQPHVDTILPQHVLKRVELEYEDNVYLPVQQKRDLLPKCKLPFVSLEIRWNGDIPLCGFSEFQTGPPGVLLGNINSESLLDAWNGDVIRQRREGLKARDVTRAPECEGCTAC